MSAASNRIAAHKPGLAAYPGRTQINLERSAHMAGVAESFIQTE
ncbi:hypothetical protein SAMN05444172_1990 [Burkholderia sp. GAS332]|jgi:hypothetical protein|nr:hypothetical protein SAMN05444172_1990 [Burkholderia sp. GAS332]